MRGRARERGGCCGGEGFSLIELLAVMAVVALLMGLMVQPIASALRAHEITNAADAIRGQMEFARSWAISMNRTVEVRLVDFGPGSLAEPGGTGVAVVDASDGRLLRKVLRPPRGVAVLAEEEWSNLVDSQAVPVSGSMDLPGKENLSYTGYTCFPDGLTDLDPLAGQSDDGIFMLTLRSEQEKAETPRNFAMIQVLPLTGRTRVWR